MTKKTIAYTLFALVAGTVLPASAKSPTAPLQLAVNRHDEVKKADVVVVRGSADHMEHVLARAKVNYVTVNADELPELPLHSRQVLMVNCRGTMSAAAADRV